MGEALIQSGNNDEKMYLVQKLLSEGKPKFQAARAVGYQGVDGLDRYAKGLGYTWNVSTKNYELVDVNISINHTSSRIMKILSMVEKGIDLDNIAKFFKMKSSTELADYMKNKGYLWDVEKNNYTKRSIAISNNKLDNDEDEFINLQEFDSRDYENDMDIMKILESNKGKLIELLSYKPQNTIPRYLLKGMPVTKGFFISIEIDRLIKDFSKEKNILQKDIIQTALIEFFKRYGFKQEVEGVLQS